MTAYIYKINLSSFQMKKKCPLKYVKKNVMNTNFVKKH